MTVHRYSKATREKVMDRLCQGMTCRQVAALFGIGRATIDNWRREAFSAGAFAVQGSEVLTVLEVTPAATSARIRWGCCGREELVGFSSLLLIQRGGEARCARCIPVQKVKDKARSTFRQTDELPDGWRPRDDMARHAALSERLIRKVFPWA